MIHIDYSKIKVGDAVYIASDDRRDNPYTAVVTKIGKKYITATQHPDCEWDKGRQFNNENGLMKEWGQYRLYPRKEFYDKMLEYKEKERFIHKMLSYGLSNATFEEIDTIYEIIKNHTK